MICRRFLLVLLLLASPAWSAVSYEGTAAAGSRTTGTSHSQAMPAWLTDDLVVIWIVSDSNESLTATQANLTFSYQTVIRDVTNTFSARLAYAIATSDQSSPASATVSSGTTEGSWSSVAVFRGVDTGTPFGVLNTADGTSDAPAVTQTTGTTSGAWAIVATGIDRNGWVTTDGQYPANTTGIHSGESGDGSGDCGGGLAYDSTSADSETYTWGTMSRSDGYGAAVYEILDGSAPAADQLMVISP